MIHNSCVGAMGAFNHYVIVKFKDGVEVEELIQGLEKMVSGIDQVKSFEWYETINCSTLFQDGCVLLSFNTYFFLHSHDWFIVLCDL